MSCFDKVSAKELTCWRLARAVVPLAVLLATIQVGRMLQAWPRDWLATTSGPLTVASSLFEPRAAQSPPTGLLSFGPGQWKP
jgi:hypothetical protein